MTIEMSSAILSTLPLPRPSQPGRGWRWFNQAIARCAQPARRDKPLWVHLPDRVWQRQSALLVSLHEMKRDE
jgi:hypothetical protein